MTLWGGRFSGKLDPAAWRLNASLPFDKRMATQDVDGSIAWAAALGRADVLTDDETVEIIAGLQTVRAEFEEDSFLYHEGDEDIHTAVERRLGELIGPLAGKLHTGRSRNDQVASDFRLWMLENLPALDRAMSGLQSVLIDRAAGDLDLLMPGYTHLQRAQPILLSHWWLAHFWPLQRDRGRLADLRKRLAILPLGSAALAGTAFPIDREKLARDLGFDETAPNSLDAVSDRDFAAEFLFAATMTGLHLSKLAESMVLFNSSEFGFFELSDGFSTGSSLMPQKKNPDMFELARGKSGTLIGLLTGLLATLKGLPSTYDKDLQEDKAPVFAGFDTLMALLPVLGGAIATLTPRPERMLAAIDAGMLATDLADYLVVKGVPFREAHAVAGKAVRLAGDRGISLDKLGLEDWRSLSELIAPDIAGVFDPQKSVEKRSATGGTAPGAVRQQIEQARVAQATTFYS